jgi:CheY-like chemotaxis protein
MTWPNLRLLFITSPPEPNLDAIAAASVDGIVLDCAAECDPVASISATRPQLPLIVLANADEETSRRLMKAGAAAVLAPDAPFAEIARAVDRSSRGSAVPPQAEAIQAADGVAQEFNNVLMVIDGHAEQLLAGLPQGDPRRARVAAISAASRRGALLTQKLLAFGRPDRNATPPATPPAVVEEPRSDSRAPTTHTPHVLLVEDDEAVRELLIDMLRSHGLRVTPVGSAEEALASGHAFDLLVTDVGLPGASGPALARQVRRRAPGLPVLFISGQSSDLVEDDAQLDAPRGFLQKPFSSRALVARVQELLNQPQK